MKPLRHFFRECSRQFTVGEQYRMVVEHERSMNAHRRYFATVNEAFNNLPEHIAYLSDDSGHILADEHGNRIRTFRNADHLRKWALIKTYWAVEQTHVLETEIDAYRFKEWIDRYASQHDEYPVTITRGNVVKVYMARSQSVHNMSREDFRRSSDDVLDFLSHLIGTSQATLLANAGQAA